LSALTFNGVLPSIVPSGILIASLIGSAHCVGMCGGLVINFAKDPKRLSLYHFGRLISYSTIGALAGYFGGEIFRIGLLRNVSWLSSILLALILISAGIRGLRGRSLHLSLPSWISSTLSRSLVWALKTESSSLKSLLLGLLSALLPCGWLYTFVLAASATQSATFGALSLGLFWLGTVPALSATPLILNQAVARFRQVRPKLTSIVLISLGLFTLGLHSVSLMAPTPHENGIQNIAPPCPLHQRR
jgi:sulfite exporter TauE/SafE